jgi:hypothetical protein
VHHAYFVPVHSATSPQEGTLALRTGRLLSGERIGLAFTCEASLLLTLGPCQEWIRLDEEALLDMLTPLGVEHIRVDPRPAAELEARNAGPVDRPGSGRQYRAARRAVRARASRMASGP